MINRSSLFLSLSFCLASSMFAGYAADTDSQDVSFDKPVQIPEAFRLTVRRAKALAPSVAQFQLQFRGTILLRLLIVIVL